MNKSIRKANIKDAKELIEYVGKVIEETDFLSFSKEDFNLSIHDEEMFLENVNNNGCMLVCEIDGHIIGTAHIEGKNNRRKHIAVFGISVLKEYWSKGIGSSLIENIIKEAKKMNFTKIELIVRVKNERALNLYKKHGFEIEGEIKNDICINGKYHNSYLMGLII